MGIYKSDLGKFSHPKRRERLYKLRRLNRAKHKRADDTKRWKEGKDDRIGRSDGVVGGSDSESIPAHSDENRFDRASFETIGGGE